MYTRYIEDLLVTEKFYEVILRFHISDKTNNSFIASYGDTQILFIKGEYQKEDSITIKTNELAALTKRVIQSKWKILEHSDDRLVIVDPDDYELVYVKG